MINLLMAPLHKDLEIIRIKGKKSETDAQSRHLGNLGFVVGAKISIVSEVDGNLIVKIKDSKVAIGKDIAKTIFVY